MEKLKRVLWHKSDNAWIQFARYVVVAGVGLAVDFGGLIFLKEVVHLNYLVATTLSFLLALIVNYFLSMMWVFPKSRHSRLKEFMMFGVIGLVGLGLNDLLMWILTSGLGVFYVLSKVISTVIVFAWNFLARKAFFAKAPVNEGSF